MVWRELSEDIINFFQTVHGQVAAFPTPTGRAGRYGIEGRRAIVGIDPNAPEMSQKATD
jgi:hypothetical protein